MGMCFHAHAEATPRYTQGTQRYGCDMLAIQSAQVLLTEYDHKVVEDGEGGAISSVTTNFGTMQFSCYRTVLYDGRYGAVSLVAPHRNISATMLKVYATVAMPTHPSPNTTAPSSSIDTPTLNATTIPCVLWYHTEL